MVHNHHEGEQDPQATTSVNTADLLKLLGQVPGGLADPNAVRMAALAHGIDFAAAADATAGFPTPPAESYPYRDEGSTATGGMHFVDDQRPVLGTGRQGRARQGWPTTDRLTETDHHLLQAGSAPAYGVSAVPVTGQVDKWAVPAHSYQAGHLAAETVADGSLLTDAISTRAARSRQPERNGGRRLGVRGIAVISATALAALLSGGAALADHMKHVSFNHSVQNTLVVPDYIPQGTEASNVLEGDIAALQQALVNPAISAESGSNSLQANRVYNEKLGALPLAILLQVGGGDPQTSGYPGVVWPLPPNVYQQDYNALVASERVHGEAISPNDANDPNTDALVVALDMNRFFAGHYQPGDTPSIEDLARAYGEYEAQRLGAPAKGAADFGQSTANLVAQWYLTLPQYNGLPKNGQQFAALAKDPTWIKHEGEIANRGIK